MEIMSLTQDTYTYLLSYSVIMGMYAIGGLELLGVLDETLSEANRKDWIEWIYAQQRIPSTAGEDSGKLHRLYSLSLMK